MRRFQLQRLLDADAAGDTLRWQNSVFSVDTRVRSTLIAHDVPSYLKILGQLKKRPRFVSTPLASSQASTSAHPRPTRRPITTPSAGNSRRSGVEVPCRDSPPDPLHAGQGAFHGGWIDLSDMLLDEWLMFFAQNLPQFYEFDPLHADGIRHADLDAGARVLNELIFECQRSLECIGHAELDLEARGWARGMGYGHPWCRQDR